MVRMRLAMLAGGVEVLPAEHIAIGKPFAWQLSDPKSLSGIKWVSLLHTLTLAALPPSYHSTSYAPASHVNTCE